MNPPVAVLLSRFPLVTETFILREIVELVRQGQPVRLVPLLRETPDVVHREAEPWVDEALYTPFLSPSILLSNLRQLLRQPVRFLSVLARTLVGSASDVKLFLGTLAIFAKSVHLAERLVAEGVTHVHAHFATHPTMAAYIISRLTGIPYSFTVHAHDIFLHRAMLAEKLRRASFVRCISRFNADFLARRYPSEATSKLQVVHVGIDPSRYACAPVIPNETRLLTVAALKAYKGHAVLLDACRLLRERGVDFELELIGDGPLRPDIERRIEDLGLGNNVEVLGSQPEHVVTEHLARSTLFVLPSVVARNGQMEGIPVALMEAMASGRPVVASSLSGVSELVEDGVSGLLVSPNDAEALAASIQLLSGNRRLASKLGKRGRRKVEADFDLESCTRKLLARFHIRAVHETQDSRVVEVRSEVEGEPRNVVYKMHRSRPGESRPPAERALREFEILTKLHSLDGRHLVPRPIEVDEKRALLAMEPCRGTRLDELLRASRRVGSPPHGSDVEAALRRAGSWLREFQSVTTEPSNGAEITRGLVAYARELAARAGSPRLIAEVDQLASKLLAEPRVACGHHGDFWPGNLFVDVEAGVVSAIDFEGYRRGLPLEDVAYFLLQLERVSLYPRWRRRFAAAFLGGYLDGAPLDEVQFRFCRVTKVLQVPGSLGSRWQGRRLRALGARRHG